MLHDSRYNECAVRDFEHGEWHLTWDFTSTVKAAGSMWGTKRHHQQERTANRGESDSVTWQHSFKSPLCQRTLPHVSSAPCISPLIQSSNPSSMHSPPLAAASAHLVTANPLASLIPQPARTHAHFRSPLAHSLPDTHAQSQMRGPTNYTANSDISKRSAPLWSAPNWMFVSCERDENSSEDREGAIPQFGRQWIKLWNL